MPQSTSEKDSNSGSDIVWWKEKQTEEARLEALNTDVSEISNDSRRRNAYDTYTSLYLNRRIDTQSALLGGYDGAFAVDDGQYTRTPYNLMKRVIDECVVRVIKTTPKAQFLTNGGDRESKRRAKGMQKFVESEMYKLRGEDKMTHMVNDSALFGLGAIKFMKGPHSNDILATRTHPGNLFVDPNEVIFNPPRRLHERAIVSKNHLASLFPKKEEGIRKSDRVTSYTVNSSWYPDYSAGLEQVELFESWHLPDYFSHDGDPEGGYRMLWVQGCLLQMHEYKRMDFPFAFMRWREDPSNMFYGVGLGEDLLGVHIDANITINRVNTAIEFMPNPLVLVRDTADVNLADITNAPATILKYSGADPPQLIQPRSVPQDLLQYVREHEARAMQIAGLSVGGGNYATPSGLETGRAVANYFQVESLPFANQLKRYENTAIDIANNIVAVGKEIFECDPKFTVLAEDEKHTIRDVPWKSIRPDPRRDSYVIRALPTSKLSELPGERLAEVERLISIGIVSTTNEARSLLGWPDIEKNTDLVTSTQDNIDRMIYLALDKGKFTPISPTTDTNLFVLRATAEAERAEDMGVPSRNVSVLNRMIARANELSQNEAQVQMMNQQGMVAPTAVPSGMNGSPPTAVTGAEGPPQ